MAVTGIPTNRTSIDLPIEVSGEILQKTQEASAVMQLARQITLPGNGAAIPVITADPEAAWVAETGAKPVSNPGLDTKIIRAYKLAVIVPFSNEFRRDAAALYDALIQRLPNALGKKFDNTVFGGTEAPGSDFDTFADLTARDLDDDAYASLVAADTDIAIHGGVVNGFALSPQARGILLSAKDENGRPLFINSVAEGAVPMILGARTYQSMGAYIHGNPDVVGFVGDWTQAMWGTVEGVQIDISDQATLSYLDDKGQAAVMNLFQQNMFAVRAEIEVGFRADTDVFNSLTSSSISA
ncbi:MAG: phage major capsid protein [Spirochaetia bacterium]|nr:phage major capsid protein [Spirochaetia bacterium]